MLHLCMARLALTRDEGSLAPTAYEVVTCSPLQTATLACRVALLGNAVHVSFLLLLFAKV